MAAPRSIVVIKLSAIGDVLHGVPAAVALRRAFPDARIGWAVEGRAADVLAGHPAIDHIFRLPRGWLKAPRAVLALRRQLRDFRPDVAIDMQGLLKSGVATWLSGAATRIGFARPASREQAWLAYTHPVRPTATHVVDRNCELLTPLGVHVAQASFDMPHWPVSRLRVAQWIASLRLPRPPVIINPGAGWATAANRSTGQSFEAQPAPGLMITGGRGSRSDATHCIIRSRLTGQWGMSKLAWATRTPRGASSSQLRSTTCVAVGRTGCV